MPKKLVPKKYEILCYNSALSFQNHSYSVGGSEYTNKRKAIRDAKILLHTYALVQVCSYDKKFSEIFTSE